MNHKALDIAFDVDPSLPRSIFSVMAFTVIALGLYAYASYELQQEALPLAAKCRELEDKLHATKMSTKELSEMVSSLSDPAADEYALVTELGRIPDGSRKVVLKPTGNHPL
jgi:hypothetical protein